jgi:hypothetical protein
MINPYSSYILTFCLGLGAFGLGWSTLYPSLSGYLLIFLLLTFLSHLAFSFYWASTTHTVHERTVTYFRPLFVTVFIYALWAIDFIYEGGIPLIKILLNQPYNYRLFGVPTLHVFTVTFASFYTVYLFSLYRATRKRLILVLYGLNLLAALLIYSRAMLLFNIAGSFFVYFLSYPSAGWKRISIIAVGVILLGYFFGFLGNLRVSFEAKKEYDADLFLDLGEASPAFRKSLIPAEFFWGYVYLSSPLANLQYNINTFHVPAFSAGRIIQHINNEMLFDFISKRTNRLLGIERVQENTLPKKPFNVSTIYSRSYSYQGWSGMMLMALFILWLPLLYRRILPDNPYALTGLAVLNTMYLFLFYDNTIRFTGLGLQLAYPFLLPVAERTHAWFQKRTAL